VTVSHSGTVCHICLIPQLSYFCFWVAVFELFVMIECQVGAKSDSMAVVVGLSLSAKGKNCWKKNNELVPQSGQFDVLIK
jgi:hypothetical protein